MIGQMIGVYQIVELVGAGGMGMVFRAFDTGLEREVALKVLLPELACQPEVAKRFRHEAITNAQLKHPNIADVYSFVPEGPAMAMEFVRGETLASVIYRQGAMSCEAAIPLFCQILAGIEHAHQRRVVHRDIKPANIMLTPEGVVKVTDFGIARVLGASRHTREGRVVGTFQYISPERTQGHEVDERSDIYSLGVVLYEMLTGRVPFESDDDVALMRMHREVQPRPPRQLAAHIPVDLERLILKALAKEPRRRFSSAAEFRAAVFPFGYAARALPVGTPLKETRLWNAGAVSAGPGYGAGDTWPGAVSSTSRPSRMYRALTSTFTRLSWKYYFLAATLVITATVASVLVLEAFRGRQESMPLQVVPDPGLAQQPKQELRRDTRSDTTGQDQPVTPPIPPQPPPAPARDTRSEDAARANALLGELERSAERDPQ